jgi:hypothetical protein
MQSSGDHQVQHQPKFTFNTNRNPLPNAAQLAYRAALNACNWRIDSPQKEDGCESNPLESLAEDPRFERGQVGRDVWQFRHCSQLAAGAGVCAMEFLGGSGTWIM